MPKIQYKFIDFFYRFIVQQGYIVVNVLIVELGALEAIIGLDTHQPPYCQMVVGKVVYPVITYVQAQAYL
ncbi:hypothetical protein MASR2M47_10630 [Draconibacterium sp.]